MMFCDDKKTEVFIILFGLSLLNPFSLGSYLLLAVCILFSIFSKSLKMDFNAVVLLLFAVSYLVFRLFNQDSDISSAVRLILFPLCYVFGYQVISNDSEIDEDRIVRIIVFLSLAFAFHGFLNMFMTIATKGIMGFGSGVYTDFWTREVTSSTGQAANYYLLFAVSGFAFFGRISGKVKVLLIVCEAIALGHCILCGVRMCIFIFIIVFFFGFFVSLYYSRDLKTFLKTLAVTAAVIVGIVLVFELNLFNIKTIYESSYLYFRLHSQYSVGLFQDDRMQRKAIYIQNVFRYPFGGQHVRRGMKIGYAHDLWLDTFDNVGVVPTVFLILYTISLFVRLFKYNQKCLTINLSVICMSMIPFLLIVFFYEPIIDSFPLFFATVCMIDGMLKKRLYSVSLYEDEDE